MNEEVHYGTDKTGAVVIHIPVDKLKNAPTVLRGFTTGKTIVDRYITIQNQPIKELLVDLKPSSKTYKALVRFLKR